MAKTRKPRKKTAAAYFGASGQLLAGYGTNGAKPRPFNVEAGIKQFRHWAYAAATLNANAVANVPMRLFVRTPEGGTNYATRPIDDQTRRFLTGRADAKPSKAVLQKVATFAGDLEEVVEPHPALMVLQRVNPYENGYSLTVLQMVDLQISGNSYAYVVTDPLGTPVEIWRLPPQYVQIIPSTTKFIDGYQYGMRPYDRRFSEPEVDHLKMPNPADLLYGMGWFEAAWSAIGLHDSKRTMDLAKFDNMARPDHIVSIKGGAKKDVMDKFEQDLKEKFGGPKNSAKFLVTAGELDVKPLNFEVDEVGTASRVIEEISAVSGVPVAMLLSNDPNRANSQSARAGWYRNTIRPYCRLHEEKLNERWLPRFEGSENMVLSYDLASFEDEEMQSKRLIGLVSGGITTPNEARAELGLSRSEDDNANRLYPPSGLTSGAAAVGGDLGPGQNDQRNN